jgi:mycothiol synthase
MPDLPRLQRALAEWIAHDGPCGYCHVGEVVHRIVDELDGRGERAELVRVWEHDGEIAGFAIEHRFDGAFEVFASPAVRGTEAEVEMLQVAADSEEARSGVEPIIDVWAGDERRVAALRRLGFEQYRVWDHVVIRALDEPIEGPSLPDGFVPASAPRAGGAFPAERVVVLAPDRDEASFAGVWIDPVNHVGRFEPDGTHEPYRRRGLARAAMVDGLRRMRAHGMTAATVEYDATNTAAARLYQSLGFTSQFVTEGWRRAR